MSLNNLCLSQGSLALIIVLIAIGVIGIIIISKCIKIVHQSEAVIVERLGKFHAVLDAGFHIIAPFIDRTLPAISLKEHVQDFEPQSVITKDNVTMKIDTIVCFYVTDPKLYMYGVAGNKFKAIENLTATTLRNIVGELDLDETLTSRDTVNTKMRSILDDATDAWGIKVTRVELKNIDPPAQIKEAMEKQMRAERERREAILVAEGEKKSTVLVAEGEKQAQILRAEAEKEATILRAEAKKAELIAEAEGTAKAIEAIVKAKPTAEYLTLQGYEALKVLADGQSTKIIVPSEIQNITGLLTSLKETVNTDIKQVQKTVKVSKPIKK